LSARPYAGGPRGSADRGAHRPELGGFAAGVLGGGAREGVDELALFYVGVAARDQLSRMLPGQERAGNSARPEVDALARRLATIPLNQLIMSKLLVNQAYENMGLRTTQLIGTVFDGVARHTPEGIAWRDMAMKEGFREAVRRRDAPFGDYGQEHR